MSREQDAVREARDGAVILAAVLLPVALLALVLGQATADTGFWVRWLLGPVVVALLVVACAAMALLVPIASRGGRSRCGLMRSAGRPP